MPIAGERRLTGSNGLGLHGIRSSVWLRARVPLIVAGASLAACSTRSRQPRREHVARTGAVLRSAAPRPLAADPPTAPHANASVALREAWNAAHIDWQSYQKGLRTARAEHKPVCLVFFATWCPHCAHYAHVFNSPEVARLARRFVMIRLDVDQNPALGARFAVDGEYVPRTYFLSSDGQLDPSISAERARFRYFYDERNPASLLGGMRRALAALGSPARR